MMFLNFYVPWDVSYLTQAQAHIVKVIGACVSVGILLFAIIAGV